MSELSATQQLVADYINAEVDHERQFKLQDWGLSQTKASCDDLDTALVALCAARPTSAEDQELRVRFLKAIDVPGRIEGTRGLAHTVICSLIGEAP